MQEPVIRLVEILRGARAKYSQYFFKVLGVAQGKSRPVLKKSQRESRQLTKKKKAKVKKREGNSSPFKNRKIEGEN
jgi:hypothetical protein